jgi:hypothetical protein
MIQRPAEKKQKVIGTMQYTLSLNGYTQEICPKFPDCATASRQITFQHSHV